MKFTENGRSARPSGWSGILIILIVLFAAAPVNALFGGKITNFTADQVFIDPGGQITNTSKIYVSEEKHRMDGIPGPGKAKDISVIVFKDEQRQIMMNSEKKLYYEGPVSENELNMKKQMEESHAKGKVLGTEKVSGFKCTKKEVETVFEFMGYKKKSKQIIWVTDKLEMPVRVQTDDGGISELRNIKKGKPDASVFEAPKDYKKVSSIMEVMGMDFSDRNQEQGASNEDSGGSGFKMPESIKNFKLPFGKKE